MDKHTEITAYIAAQKQHSTLTGKNANTLVAFLTPNEDGEDGHSQLMEVRMDDVHVTTLAEDRSGGRLRTTLFHYLEVEDIEAQLGITVVWNRNDPLEAVIFPERERLDREALAHRLHMDDELPF